MVKTRWSIYLAVIILFTSCKASETKEQISVPDLKLANIISKTADDAALIFEETLNKTYDYFEHLQKCETETQNNTQEICFTEVKKKYKNHWGSEAHPQNVFRKDLRLRHPVIRDYTGPEFNWKISLHGRLDNFVLGGQPVFPPEIHGDLVNLYVDYHAKHNGIMRFDSKTANRPTYKVESLEVLRDNFSEFRLADYMPKKNVSPRIVAGHEFKMISGKKLIDHSVWNTNYSRNGCRKHESFFYKLKIEYDSEWLAGYLGNRDVAYLHVCAADKLGLPRNTIFKLGFSIK